jgi:hypothetical protein
LFGIIALIGIIRPLETTAIRITVNLKSLFILPDLGILSLTLACSARAALSV